MIEEHASMNRIARLAGGLYLLVALFAAFGNMYVPSVLLARDDPLTTSRNIMASEWLYRSGIVSSLIGQILFVLLVLALYRLLKDVNGLQAALMAVLALLAIPLAVLNEVNHLAVLRLLNGGGTQAFSPTQLQAQAMLFLDLWEAGIVVAMMFWGLWLLPLGVLVSTSGFLPKLLGVLLVVSGTGYVVDSATQLLLPGFATVSQFTFLGELLFPLWLLIKGVGTNHAKPGKLA